MKRLFLIAAILLVILFLGRNLNPISSKFFTFHDSTQPARIQQFTLNLKNVNIPPRVAPDFNYGLGYPVFNFYAPFSYWLTSIVNLLGFNVITSLKLSFIFALVVGFLGSFLFFLVNFSFFSALLGGFLYITSLYFPLNIFVRGNLAETWFLALFPLSLFLIYKNSLKINNKTFISTTIIIAFLLTSHNLLSLISLPIILLFMLIQKNKTQNLLSFFIAVLITMHFWLPAISEMKYTWAKEVATSTNYQDHFLCLNQLWQSSWGFGGSTKGCINDGMSFMIGKIQLITAGFGLLLFLLNKKTNNNTLGLFMFFTSFAFLFLTLYQSRFIWETFSPLLSIIQFPWRLIGPALLGVVFFSVYFLNALKIPLKNILIFTFLIVLLNVNGKYFQGQEITNNKFEEKFISQEYIENKAAYAVAEYLPKTIDYKYWRSLEKQSTIPEEFYINSSIKPFNKNEQTPIEIAGNILSLTGVVILLWTTLKRKRLFQR